MPHPWVGSVIGGLARPPMDALDTLFSSCARNTGVVPFRDTDESPYRRPTPRHALSRRRPAALPARSIAATRRDPPGAAFEQVATAAARPAVAIGGDSPWQRPGTVRGGWLRARRQISPAPLNPRASQPWRT